MIVHSKWVRVSADFLDRVVKSQLREPVTLLMSSLAWADGAGICPAWPAWLRAHPLFYDRNVSDSQVVAWLTELTEAGLITLFESGDDPLFAIMGWDQVSSETKKRKFRYGPEDAIPEIPPQDDGTQPLSAASSGASSSSDASKPQQRALPGMAAANANLPPATSD